MAVWILYNPLAGGDCRETAECLCVVLDEEPVLYDITKITNYATFLSGLEQGDKLVIVGGDGTLNRFVNDTRHLDLTQEICYFPCGTGNDFACDLGQKTPGMPIPITDYLRSLPTVEVKGRQHRFVNAVGFGVDGYCCVRGDELRKEGKPINYASIAVEGLLGRFRPVNAQITVDGTSHSFRRVWIAPTLHGRYYGGGMMAAPQQDRTGETLSVVVFHTAGALMTLLLFPKIFSGKHVRHRRYVTVLTGREIAVRFDRPAPLQIDGETVEDVECYTACAAQRDRVDARKAAPGL